MFQFLLRRDDVNRPGRRVFGGTGTAPRIQRVVFGVRFRLHKEFAERGVRPVRRVGRERHLRVGGKFNPTRPVEWFTRVIRGGFRRCLPGKQKSP